MRINKMLRSHETYNTKSLRTSVKGFLKNPLVTLKGQCSSYV